MSRSEIDATPHEIVLTDALPDPKRPGAIRKVITFDNPYGLGGIEIEYDDPPTKEQVELILSHMPKIFFEKDGKPFGFEEILTKVGER